MVRLIGLALLLYGLAGVVAAVVVYFLLTRPQGPLARLKEFLTHVAEKLNEGAAAATRAGGFADRARQALDDALTQLGFALPRVEDLHEHASAAGIILRSVEAGLNGVTVPVPSPTTTNLPNLSVSIPTVTDIEATYFGTVPGVNIDVYGPPYTLKPGNVQATIPGPSGLPWFTINNAHPLRPVGAEVGRVALEVETARDQVGHLKQTLERLTLDVRDGKAALEELKRDVVDPLPGQLGDLRGRVLEARDSKLWSLALLFLLGCFGLIHLAFALAGFALVIV